VAALVLALASELLLLLSLELYTKTRESQLAVETGNRGNRKKTEENGDVPQHRS
jgi:hypothetical protein